MFFVSFICLNQKEKDMWVRVNLNFHDDFLLTCDTMHVDVRDAIKCYTDNVKLFEVSDIEGMCAKFKATRIFFCVYVPWCLALDGGAVDLRNRALVVSAIGEIQRRRMEGDLVLDSQAYRYVVDRLFLI